MLSPAVRANPDTHCATCGEVLSKYGHCWQCHYPPMDPAQDVPPLCSLTQAQRIIALLEKPFEPPTAGIAATELLALLRANLPPGWLLVDKGGGQAHAHSGGDLSRADWQGELVMPGLLSGVDTPAKRYASLLIRLLERNKPHLKKPLKMHRWGYFTTRKRR